jgi:hypothetical protein
MLEARVPDAVLIGEGKNGDVAGQHVGPATPTELEMALPSGENVKDHQTAPARAQHLTHLFGRG